MYEYSGSVASESDLSENSPSDRYNIHRTLQDQSDDRFTKLILPWSISIKFI